VSSVRARGNLKSSGPGGTRRADAVLWPRSRSPPRPDPGPVTGCKERATAHAATGDAAICHSAQDSLDGALEGLGCPCFFRPLSI
jgi:hypothetical protein